MSAGRRTRLPSNDELLAQALDTFADGGYDGTSVRDLCRRLGVSHNLVHERFGSKERLWYAAVDNGFQDLAVALADAAQESEKDLLERLRAILLRYVEVMAERPALIRIINAEAAQPGPRLDYIFEQYIAPAHEIADGVLTTLAKEGRARRISPAVLHFLVGHGAAGLVSMPGLSSQFEDDRQTLTDQAKAAVEVVLAGILLPPE